VDFLSPLRRLWTPPADRRLALAMAAEASALEPAAPSMPPRVALVPGTGDQAAQRRRIFADEQRQGIRTPWVPVGLRWRFEDMEEVWQAAEIGNCDPLARMVEAMRSEGVTSGLMDARCAFVSKPATFSGDPYLCSMLRGEPAKYDPKGRLILRGKRGIFRRMHPTAALLDLLYTAILAGVAVAEYVDDPVTGLPVLHTRDLHRLRYDWGERCWKYRGQEQEYLVEPGNGRWVLFMPKSTYRPWRSGAWLPLALAFIVMITTTYDAARFQKDSADPLKYIEVPDGMPADEVERLDEFVQLWWERSPGIVLRYQAKAGIVETNGIGHQIYTHQREWAKQQINFTLRGSMGTSGESAGILNDNETAAEVSDELIAGTAAALAECLSEQGIAPWFRRMGLITSNDEAPTCSWDTRRPKRRIEDAKAAGEVAKTVLLLNQAMRDSGESRRVNAPEFFLQCGLTIPLLTVTTELVDEDGNALWSGEAEVYPELPPATGEDTSSADRVTTQTQPDGSLE
jgi:hypothetical protein